MSALLRLAANGDICAFLRLPSRNISNCVAMNCAGCAASDGFAAIDELPSGPWQAVQTCAFCRPASRAAACADGAADTDASNGKIAAAARRHDKDHTCTGLL